MSEQFPEHIILLVLDNAGWHMTREENSKRRHKDKNAEIVFKAEEKLMVPSNTRLAFIPLRTPEMSPIETIWREICRDGFKNKLFESLDAVLDTFNAVVSKFSPECVISVTYWHWIKNFIYQVF